jgi:hypothetical protein
LRCLFHAVDALVIRNQALARRGHTITTTPASARTAQRPRP